jgi:hypothetical protein
VPPAKKSRLGLILGLVVGIPIVLMVGFCAVVGAAVNSADKEIKAEKFAKEKAIAAKPVTSVTAKELFQAYEANEMRANAKYGGYRLRVSGTVDSIDSDFMDDAVIKLRGGSRWQHVSARGIDASDAARLSKGESVILLCDSVNEVIGSPQLSDCGMVN